MGQTNRFAITGALPILLLITLAQVPPSMAGEAAGVATVAQGTAIIEMMMQKRARHCSPKSYSVTRIFQAESPRFKKKAVMTVQTTIGADGKTESILISDEGSDFIRKQVFQKILEAEHEADRGRKEIDITPDNYRFAFEGNDIWKGRESYVFRITPLHKGKYSINGKIWLDREDLQIARIMGSPAKRPSFWTSAVEVEKEFVKRGQQWFPSKLKSTSSVFVAGKSNLVIEYFYPEDSLASAAAARDDD